jgi:hypothetical protein
VPSSSSSSRRERSRVRLGILALALLAAPLAAHDHWIAPSSFHPAALERVDVCLRVGHPSSFEEQLRDPRKYVRFESIGADGARALLGLDGRAPAAFFKPRAAGDLWLVYQSNYAFVEIEAEKYARYLEDEGLTAVRAERERRGETTKAGRDSYARFDKALLRIGPGLVEDYGRVLGLPLEFVLESEPRVGAGDELVLRLLSAEQPLADHQVKWMRLDAPHTIALGRTDAEGRVRFPLMAGPFVASTVEQRRADPALGLEGDWESRWASLAFEIRE